MIKMALAAGAGIIALMAGSAFAQVRADPPDAATTSPAVRETPAEANRRMLPPQVDPRVPPSETVKPAEDPAHRFKTNPNNP